MLDHTIRSAGLGPEQWKRFFVESTPSNPEHHTPLSEIKKSYLCILVILYNWIYLVSDATVYGETRHGRNRIGHLALNLRDLGNSW